MTLVCDALVVTATPKARTFFLGAGSALCFSILSSPEKGHVRCPVARAMCQSRSTQTKPAGVASASPAPLALAVPTLQAADVPLPHGQHNMFTHCALRRQTAVVQGGPVMLEAGPRESGLAAVWPPR